MKHPILISALFVAAGLAACDKPTVVNVPAPVAVPGPAGPQGATGDTGATGKTGDGSTTVVVVQPAASSPTN